MTEEDIKRAIDEKAKRDLLRESEKYVETWQERIERLERRVDELENPKPIGGFINPYNSTTIPEY